MCWTCTWVQLNCVHKQNHQETKTTSILPSGLKVMVLPSAWLTWNRSDRIVSCLGTSAKAVSCTDFNSSWVMPKEKASFLPNYFILVYTSPASNQSSVWKMSPGNWYRTTKQTLSWKGDGSMPHFESVNHKNALFHVKFRKTQQGYFLSLGESCKGKKNLVSATKHFHVCVMPFFWCRLDLLLPRICKVRFRAFYETASGSPRISVSLLRFWGLKPKAIKNKKRQQTEGNCFFSFLGSSTALLCC